MKRKGVKRLRCICMGRILSAVLLVMGISSIAAAIQIPTGNEDVELRWDNTFRYNFGVRTLTPQPAILGNINIDDGDRNFSKGTVTNRLDILSEFDLRFKKDYGFRFSGAGWYDQRYHDPLGNDSVLTSNHIQNGHQVLGLSDTTKSLFAGPDGELLDAFVFGKVDLGLFPLSFKVGRHTLFWGEAMLFGGAINGLSYSQFPVDAAKGFANPGAEAKELFRPLASVSAQAQLSKTFTVDGQYFFQWEPYRFPEAGSYLSPSDIFLNGAESLLFAPGVFARHGQDQNPNGTKDWGIATHWTPEFLEGGGIGLYYRHFTDKLPQTHLDIARNEFFFAYPDNIDLYGVSFSKQILGISVAMEYNYRHNMPLVSSAALVLPGMQRPNVGDTLGARGDIHGGLINFLGIINKTPVWDTATWILEFTYSRWEKVTQGEQYFLGRDGYNALNRVSKDAWGGSLSFKPVWFEVFPSMDLSMPINFSIGLSGNSALFFSDNQGAGSASAGFSLDMYKKYNLSLSYYKFFGDYDRDSTGALSVFRGAQALLSDRDFIGLTFKVTY